MINARLFNRGLRSYVWHKMLATQGRLLRSHLESMFFWLDNYCFQDSSLRSESCWYIHSNFRYHGWCREGDVWLRSARQYLPDFANKKERKKERGNSISTIQFLIRHSWTGQICCHQGKFYSSATWLVVNIDKENRSPTFARLCSTSHNSDYFVPKRAYRIHSSPIASTPRPRVSVVGPMLWRQDQDDGYAVNKKNSITHVQEQEQDWGRREPVRFLLNTSGRSISVWVPTRRWVDVKEQSMLHGSLLGYTRESEALLSSYTQLLTATYSGNGRDGLNTWPFSQVWLLAHGQRSAQHGSAVGSRISRWKMVRFLWWKVWEMRSSPSGPKRTDHRKRLYRPLEDQLMPWEE